MVGAKGPETDDTTGVAQHDAILVQWQDSSNNYHVSTLYFDKTVGGGTDIAAADVTLFDMFEVGSTVLVAGDLAFV